MAGQPLQGAEPRRRPVPCRGADQRHEDRDERQAHRDQYRTDPVRPGHDRDHRDRDDDGEEELGQVAREIAVEGVDPCGEQDAELARRSPVEARGPERSDVLCSRHPQLRLGGRGRPVCGALRGPRQHGPTRNDERQRDQGRP